MNAEGGKPGGVYMGGGKFGMSALDPLVWYDGGDVEDSEAVAENYAVSESVSEIVAVPGD